MKFNNRMAIALLSAGAVIGTAGVVALQTHAQQAPVSTSQVQIQTPAPQATPTAAADKVTAQDTDNIQDPGGVEQADTAGATEVKDAETNDDQGKTAVSAQDKDQDGETNDDAGSAPTK